MSNHSPPERRSGIILASSWATAPGSCFEGTAYLDDAIIIGQEGFDSYCARTPADPNQFRDGRFAALLRADHGLLAFTDCFGQDAFFYYVKGAQWALSNSFLALARHLHAQGVSLTLHPPALLPMLVSHSSTQQLLSNQTAIKEIRVLPKDRQLRVNGNSVTIERRGDDGHNAPYAQLLVEFVTKWSSRLQGLSRYFGDTLRVDISGGVDTRILLALLLAHDRDLSQWSFGSNKALPEDYAVAQLLAGRFGFSIANRPMLGPLAEPELAYELWKLGNLGVYWPVCWPTAATPVFAASLHGGSGECFRRFYRPANGLSLMRLLRGKTQNQALRQATDSGLAEAFQEMSCDPFGPDSLMEHYRHFRSRFHFGRNWFRSLSSCMITPMASPELLRASNQLSPEQRKRSQLQCDLMLLVEPELARLPFDDTRKSFSTIAMESSPFFGSRPSLERPSRQLTVFGSSPAPGAEKGGSRGRSALVPLLLADLKNHADAARSLGILPVDCMTAAVERIQTGSRITRDAAGTAQIIAVGELVRLCRS